MSLLDETSREIEIRNLRVFLAWFVAGAVSFALALALLAYSLGEARIGWTSAALWAVAAVGGTSLALLLRLGTELACALVAYSALAFSVVGELLFPNGHAAFLLVPVLVVAMGLPYLHGWTLHVLLGSCVLVEVGLALAGQVVVKPGLPLEIRLPLVVSGTCTAALLTFMLLMQFSSRVQRLLRQTREAVHQREDFLSIAAHELRTPLTSMKLRIQTLRKGQDDLARGELLERLAQVEQQVDRIARLIEQMLDISRIQAGHLSLEFSLFDVVQVVRDLLSQFQDAAADVGSQLRLEAPPELRIQTDRGRFEQVITNLISNAIKYGMGRPVEVKVEQEAGSARISVRDRGLGIPAAEIGKLFRRFERTSSGRRMGGLGLGLFISKRIVEALDGQISVISKEGEGATFVVQLPLRLGPQPMEVPPRAPGAAA